MSLLNPYRCTQCTRQVLRNNEVARSFSTSIARRVIGPESPSFVEVPQPAQRIPKWKAPIKGFVPTPRNILKKKKYPKESPEFLQLTTPAPRSDRHPPGEYDRVHAEFKQRLSATRRRYLREGIAEISQREREELAKRAAISERRQRERDALLYEAANSKKSYLFPQVTEDVKMSLRPEIIKNSAVFNRQRRKYTNTLNNELSQRIDHLHELYLNARTFILTEGQLDEAIHKEFTEVETMSEKPTPPNSYEIVGMKTKTNTSSIFEATLEQLGGALTGGTFSDPHDPQLVRDNRIKVALNKPTKRPEEWSWQSSSTNF